MSLALFTNGSAGLHSASRSSRTGGGLGLADDQNLLKAASGEEAVKAPRRGNGRLGFQKPFPPGLVLAERQPGVGRSAVPRCHLLAVSAGIKRPLTSGPFSSLDLLEGREKHPEALALSFLPGTPVGVAMATPCSSWPRPVSTGLAVDHGSELWGQGLDQKGRLRASGLLSGWRP